MNTYVREEGVKIVLSIHDEAIVPTDWPDCFLNKANEAYEKYNEIRVHKQWRFPLQALQRRFRGSKSNDGIRDNGSVISYDSFSAPR